MNGIKIGQNMQWLLIKPFANRETFTPFGDRDRLADIIIICELKKPIIATVIFRV